MLIKFNVTTLGYDPEDVVDFSNNTKLADSLISAGYAERVSKKAAADAGETDPPKADVEGAPEAKTTPKR